MDEHKDFRFIFSDENEDSTEIELLELKQFRRLRMEQVDTLVLISARDHSAWPSYFLETPVVIPRMCGFS